MALTFTGTDDEKAWKQRFHDLFLVNELGGGVSAYEIRFAGTSNSGYSFGYARMGSVTIENDSHYCRA